MRNNGVWRSPEGVKVDIVRRPIDARTIAELESARRNEELPTSSGVTLVLDADIMGVGGVDSWSRIAAPRPPYRPQGGTYTLTVELSEVPTTIEMSEVFSQ